MKNKAFLISLIAIVLVFGGIVIASSINRPPEPPRPGTEHNDGGREHTETTEYGGESPPTSGAHANPVAWGPYTEPVRDDQAIHNLEHGGIYVSYSPSLPKEDVKKLTELLFAPFSNPEFQPKKIVLAPRASNKSPIELSSWRRSEKLTSYDAEKIQTYVKLNVGKSPEPLTP